MPEPDQTSHLIPLPRIKALIYNLKRVKTTKICHINVISFRMALTSDKMNTNYGLVEVLKIPLNEYELQILNESTNYQKLAPFTEIRNKYIRLNS